MFYEKPYADEFVRVWEKIARRLKGRRFIWGYDLVNEPVHDMALPEGMEDFRELQIRASRAIRAIDPEIPIIFEEYDWDWSYHAYREAQCWSLEHTEEQHRVERAPEPTERLKVIKKWFAKNERAK